MMLRVIIISLFLFFNSHLQLWAQRELNNDAAIWMEAELAKKLFDKWDLSLNQQLRINYNISELGRSSTELSLGYKLHKNLKLVGGYSLLSNRNLDETYIQSHRIFGSVTYSKDWNLWEMQYRFRIQTARQLNGEPSNGSIRNKLVLKYVLNKRVKPFVSYELFYSLDVNDPDRFNRERYCLGFTYKLNKQLLFEPYFMLRNELNAPNETDRDFIYGFKTSYKF